MTNGEGPGTKPNGILERALDRLFEAIKSLPAPLRTVVVIFLIAAGAAIAYEYYHKSLPPSTADKPPTAFQLSTIANPQNTTNPSFTNVITFQAGSTPPANATTAPALPGAPSSISSSNKSIQYVGGQPDPNHSGAENNNPQNLEAAHKSAEDDEAFRWHSINVALDNPPEVQIVPDTDTDNYLHYRYFAKSDKCVFINRRENGHDTYQWVRDPAYHKHDIDASKNAEMQHLTVTQTASGTRNLVFGVLDRLMPAVLAANQSAGEPPIEPVQASGPQYCINPHPGNFRFWWGPPIDQCNSPMYRQFGDGCTHYQVYNRCANSWDARIFWTYCHPPPHG
jgi:hypothetical protein